jgi:hypothetical protein
MLSWCVSYSGISQTTFVLLLLAAGASTFLLTNKTMQSLTKSCYVAGCRYFYIPARKEHRGIGGLFFDDLDATGAAFDVQVVQQAADQLQCLTCLLCACPRHSRSFFMNTAATEPVVVVLPWLQLMFSCVGHDALLEQALQLHSTALQNKLFGNTFVYANLLACCLLLLTGIH